MTQNLGYERHLVEERQDTEMSALGMAEQLLRRLYGLNQALAAILPEESMKDGIEPEASGLRDNLRRCERRLDEAQRQAQQLTDLVGRL